jgi:hypothetical protein
MLSLFTSSKARLEQRMLRQCLNTEKPEALVAMNLLGRPAALVQPVTRLGDAPPVVLNTLSRREPPPGDGRNQALPVARKKRRRAAPLSF